MRNPFDPIVNFDDYKEIIGVPKDQLSNQEVQNRINKWLVQATEQFDSMISGSGDLGRIYRWYQELKENKEDEYKKYKIKKSICSWVETFVIKGKFWVDGMPAINSNVNIEISASSDDSNVEAKRKDIIQDLVSLGLYQTTNFGGGNTVQEYQLKNELENLIVMTKEDLDNNYLKRKPQAPLLGNLDFANNDIINGGNIEGNLTHAKPYLKNYEIIESKIDLNRNNIIGKFPNAVNADYILDPIANVYKMINQFDAHYFGTLTTQEIYNAIYAAGMEWRPDILYKVRYITQRINAKNEIAFYECLEENINKDPLLPENAQYWKELSLQKIDVNALLNQIREQLNEIVKEEVNKQPTLNFIMEAEGQVLEFQDDNDYNQFKQQYGIDDSYFENVEERPPTVPILFFEDTTLISSPIITVRANGSFSFGLDLFNLASNEVSSLFITLINGQKIQAYELGVNEFLKSKFRSFQDFEWTSLQKFYTPSLTIKNVLFQIRRQRGETDLNVSVSFDNEAEMNLEYNVAVRKVRAV